MPFSSQMANQIASTKVRYKRLARSMVSWQSSMMKLRIRKLRDQRKLTGDTLAAKVGCSKSYLSARVCSS